jgi:hypothetical protein
MSDREHRNIIPVEVGKFEIPRGLDPIVLADASHRVEEWLESGGSDGDFSPTELVCLVFDIFRENIGRDDFLGV